MKKIMVIDDEPSLLKIMGKFIEKLKCESITVSNGRQGLEIFREDPHSFKAVIIDYNLPNESSEDLLVNMKALNPSIITVLTTGYSTEEIKGRFTQVSIDKTLQKPFTFQDFSKIIESL